MILADSEFTVHDGAGLYCAEVKIPAFTKRKAQLTRQEVDTTHEITHVRIHVERVIGPLKSKYRFLKSIFPVSLLMCNPGDENDSVIDIIVTVCAALCNCCESVVPFE